MASSVEYTTSCCHNVLHSNFLSFSDSPIVTPGTAHISNGNVYVTWTYDSGSTLLYLSSEYNVGWLISASFLSANTFIHILCVSLPSKVGHWNEFIPMIVCVLSYSLYACECIGFVANRQQPLHVHTFTFNFACLVSGYYSS